MLLDASRLLKPRTLAIIDPKAIFYYRKSRAWELRVSNEATARKVVKIGHADLVGKTKLTASDPFFHHLELFVSYPEGFLQADGLAETKRDTEAADLKRAILQKGKEVFGPKGVKLTGHDGAYLLAILPTRPEFRGKFSPQRVTAGSLEEIQKLLDAASEKVQSLL
jgi:hypothetical protein